ncbi:MAG: TAXI family TRAP transporter solute-binding subunit [Bosea sp.]|uniref:TAXI family TRAP transporter solute-binding subunit n=1 Tax=unclassified Bosea (in: a-proteobacteria) TaxID=2653178 RepID=UPI00095E51FD|nr:MULTISPECIES: TAXI family TRAP transporter solute-binding subunit [unclassified Bosea (in: a-proteobacteria)]MBN9443946.1 TAXI family TRAP transporter solute-binding subunit [Bosea sp. (in: a-proteobacteria)]MBN9455313.1 TAXI family TRAP transporter solute-binding subunit [Bosea sp. (in: a-proteobacteria)]OJV04933.1 MAG: immunogenic protein [Bosea sp. 67-29]
MALRFRSKLAAAGLVLGGAALAAGLAFAQAPAFFRIGTGGTAGTYYPIGGLIANAISNPPQLVATAVASNGSVANVNAIVSGAAESGFVQADVAYWAYSGTGVFQGKPKVEELRSIANLYPESVHLVVRKAANVKSIADLKGKKVSLDEPGSGTLLNAKAILGAFGVTEKDIKAEFVKPNQAAEQMKDGSLDAFFFTGGFPAAAISELASTGSGIDILPIAGPEIDKLRKESPFFSADEIPADTYKGVGAVKTVAVGAHWVTSSKISADTVYAVTKALWNDKTRAALDAGHAKGKAIRKETALSGLQGVPLHAGAERFYKEAGLLK